MLSLDKVQKILAMIKNIVLTILLSLCGIAIPVNAQVMRAADLEKYAKERYGDKWLDAAANLAKDKTALCSHGLLLSVPYDCISSELHAFGQ